MARRKAFVVLGLGVFGKLNSCCFLVPRTPQDAIELVVTFVLNLSSTVTYNAGQFLLLLTMHTLTVTNTPNRAFRVSSAMISALGH